MTAPRTPTGCIAAPARQLDRTRGEVACWRHTEQLPAIKLSLCAAGEHGGYPDQPAHVRISHHPIGGPIGVTDPAELRQIAWMYLDAARWLDRQQPDAGAVEPDPQLSIYDHLQEASR